MPQLEWLLISNGSADTQGNMSTETQFYAPLYTNLPGAVLCLLQVPGLVKWLSLDNQLSIYGRQVDGVPCISGLISGHRWGSRRLTIYTILPTPPKTRGTYGCARNKAMCETVRQRNWD